MSFRVPGVEWPVAVTLALVVTALFAQPAARDAAGGGLAVGARIVLPAAYVALAPLLDVLDALCRLTPHQHIAVVLTVLVASAGTVRHPRTGGRDVGRTRQRVVHALVHALVRALTRALLALVALIAVYAAATLAPRPMASLALADGDELTVDVHSHTSASHDGRAGFGARESRAWHQAGGFDVAYVTDHRGFSGAVAGSRSNPRTAGDGTVLLSGIETRYAGAHLNLLGATIRDSSMDRNGDLDAAQFRAITEHGASAPISILTIPADLEHLPTGVRLRGIEVADAAPRGIEAAHANSQRILHLADSLDLALVAGSDNHGWGRTAAAWTVMRIPGWRGMAPAALDRAIRTSIDRDRRRATRVVVRSVVAPPRFIAGLVLTVPSVGWDVLTTLSRPERLSWLGWTWLVWLTWLGRAGVKRARTARSVGSPARRFAHA